MPTKGPRITSASDELQALLEGNGPILSQAIEACYLEAKAYLKANSGTSEEAQDLVQEAVLVALKQAREGRLTLTSSLGAYLTGICKNFWRRRLREKKRMGTVTNEFFLEYTPGGKSWQEVEEEERLLAARQNLYLKKLKELGAPCKKLLELDTGGLDLKTIGKILGYTYDYARQKKGKCLSKLIEMIQNDPIYKEISHSSDLKS